MTSFHSPGYLFKDVTVKSGGFCSEPSIYSFYTCGQELWAQNWGVGATRPPPHTAMPSNKCEWLDGAWYATHSIIVDLLHDNLLLYLGPGLPGALYPQRTDSKDLWVPSAKGLSSLVGKGEAEIIRFTGAPGSTVPMQRRGPGT